MNPAPRTRRLVHLRALDRGVPRPGLSVHSETATHDDPGRPLGVLTSGAYSPTLRTGLGMAYLPLAYAKPHTRLTVNLRGRLLPVEVVRRPFYKRPE